MSAPAKKDEPTLSHDIDYGRTSCIAETLQTINDEIVGRFNALLYFENQRLVADIEGLKKIIERQQEQLAKRYRQEETRQRNLALYQAIQKQKARMRRAERKGKSK